MTFPSPSYCVHWSWSPGVVAKHRARVSLRVWEEFTGGREGINSPHENDIRSAPGRSLSLQGHHLHPGRNLGDLGSWSSKRTLCYHFIRLYVFTFICICIFCHYNNKQNLYVLFWHLSTFISLSSCATDAQESLVVLCS